MKRFDTYIGSADSAFQQAPEVLQPVGVNRAINVSNGMVDNFMGVLSRQSFVGFQIVAVESRACLNMLLDFGLKRSLSAVPNNKSSHFTTALQDSHHGSLVFAASSSYAAFPLCDVHIAGLAADEGLINFYISSHSSERAVLQGKP